MLYHTLIFFLYLYFCAMLLGSQYLSLAVIRQEAGDTLDMLPVYHRATYCRDKQDRQPVTLSLTTSDNFELTGNLIFMLLETKVPGESPLIQEKNIQIPHIKDTTEILTCNLWGTDDCIAISFWKISLNFNFLNYFSVDDIVHINVIERKFMVWIFILLVGDVLVLAPLFFPFRHLINHIWLSKNQNEEGLSDLFKLFV